MAGLIDAKLAELGIALPSPWRRSPTTWPIPSAAAWWWSPARCPPSTARCRETGKLGAGVSIEQGAQAARQSFINVLVHLKAACNGDLDRVRRVVRLGGFVACAPDFTQHAQVMNGASDLAVAVFGDPGRHARTTIGVAALPLDAAVEVEGMFEIDIGRLDARWLGRAHADAASADR